MTAWLYVTLGFYSLDVKHEPLQKISQNFPVSRLEYALQWMEVMWFFPGLRVLNQILLRFAIMDERGQNCQTALN